MRNVIAGYFFFCVVKMKLFWPKWKTPEHSCTRHRNAAHRRVNAPCYAILLETTECINIQPALVCVIGMDSWFAPTANRQHFRIDVFLLFFFVLFLLLLPFWTLLAVHIALHRKLQCTSNDSICFNFANFIVAHCCSCSFFQSVSGCAFFQLRIFAVNIIPSHIHI